MVDILPDDFGCGWSASYFMFLSVGGHVTLERFCSLVCIISWRLCQEKV